jgi:hypothetical protein
MAVGDEDSLDLDPLALCSLEDAVELAAGVGDGALHGLLAPQERAVLLERRDRNDDGAHAANPWRWRSPDLIAARRRGVQG